MKYLLLCFMLMLAGCVDKGACLKSHKELVLVPIYTTTCNGSSCMMTLITMIPSEVDHCDLWEFPDGKPKVEE